MIKQFLDTPWKVENNFLRLLLFPYVRLLFFFKRIIWRKHWKIFGVPIILKHRNSHIQFGDCFQLRSSSKSNPLRPNHAVMITTWKKNAIIDIGNNFSMTGGVICSSEKIKIGDNVNIGANTSIVDSDFHPIDPDIRKTQPQLAKSFPIVIEDDVFVGMNCLILKGVKIGKGSVVGAGSVVSKSIPSYSIAAGNPAKVIKKINPE